MIVGENGKTDDIEVNVCKTKKLTTQEHPVLTTP